MNGMVDRWMPQESNPGCQIATLCTHSLQMHPDALSVMGVVAYPPKAEENHRPRRRQTLLYGQYNATVFSVGGKICQCAPATYVPEFCALFLFRMQQTSATFYKVQIVSMSDPLAVKSAGT